MWLDSSEQNQLWGLFNRHEDMMMNWHTLSIQSKCMWIIQATVCVVKSLWSCTLWWLIYIMVTGSSDTLNPSYVFFIFSSSSNIIYTLNWSGGDKSEHEWMQPSTALSASVSASVCVKCMNHNPVLVQLHLTSFRLTLLYIPIARVCAQSLKAHRAEPDAVMGVCWLCWCLCYLHPFWVCDLVYCCSLRYRFCFCLTGVCLLYCENSWSANTCKTSAVFFLWHWKNLIDALCCHKNPSSSHCELAESWSQHHEVQLDHRKTHAG